MSTQLAALRAHVASRPFGGAATRGVGGGRGEDGPTILVVGSGKGGAGTSTVAATLALSVAALDRRVLLVDLDPHVGPQRYLLGVTPRHALGALRAGVAPEALPEPVSATLSLLSCTSDDGSPSAPPMDAAERRALLRRTITTWTAHDLTVVDAGSRLDDVRAGLDAARAARDHARATTGTCPRVRLLVVANADPIALAASYALVKHVAADAIRDAARDPGYEADDAPLDVEVLVNRADADAAHAAFAQLDEGTRRFLPVDLPHALRSAGALPDDPCLGAALRAGMPLQDAAAGSPAALALQPIAARLAAASIPPAGARVGPARRHAALAAYSGSVPGLAR